MVSKSPLLVCAQGMWAGTVSRWGLIFNQATSLNCSNDDNLLTFNICDGKLEIQK